MGGLHVTAIPSEAARHANTIFLGPAEDTWPKFLRDFKAGRPENIYLSKNRSLADIPRIRRDLFKRNLYLVPNSIVVSRGCPCHCDFCYKDSFFRGGKSFYTQQVDNVLTEIETLPGKHLFFLDDHLFGDVGFAGELFNGMAGMGRLWQAAGTVTSVLKSGLLQKAVNCGLRSLFIGFETLNSTNLKGQNKRQNPDNDYEQAIKRLQDMGVMINASFVFGMDDDDSSVFDRTVEWAINNGIETATFHILTPYPGTRLYKRMLEQGRIQTKNWDLYDTRHAVYKPSKLTPIQLEQGYCKAYHEFYKWRSIFRSATVKNTVRKRLRHLVYTGGWKKFEPLWNVVTGLKRVNNMLPLLESILAGFGASPNSIKSKTEKTVQVPSSIFHNSAPHF
jgi:radical SAM superfamily enzyme YgiQ (UPF0313 family)